jgi:spore coat protein U-like protein
MSFRNLSLIAAALVVAGAAGTASAATDTKNFNVTMTITGACDIHTGTATNVDFGSTAAGGSDKTATGNLIVNCSNGASYAITLNNGNNYSAGRRMKSGANYIPYDLYSDAGFTTAWASVSGTGNGLDQNIPVYGKVLAASYASSVPGNYTDTVTATVTY